MKLSVVILNYNVRYFLEQCILSVQRAIGSLDAEIIVIDNNSSDDSCKMVKERFTYIKLIENKENVGFAVATGRTIDSAYKVLEKNGIPYPSIIISSVGSEIHYNFRGKLIYSKGWHAHLDNQWSRNKIVKLLSRLKHLEYQEEENQREFKRSYYTSEIPGYVDKVKNVLIRNK